MRLKTTLLGDISFTMNNMEKGEYNVCQSSAGCYKDEIVSLKNTLKGHTSYNNLYALFTEKRANNMNLISCSESFTSNSSGELEISAHNGNSLSVDSAEVSIFEKTDEVRFGGFLEGQDSGGLESKVSLEVVGDFSDESLEGELSDQKIGGLLVLSNFSESDGTGSVSVGLLNTTSGGGALSGSLGGELLSGSLSTG